MGEQSPILKGTKMFNNLILDCAEYLGIELPYRIELFSGTHQEASAHYWCFYRDNKPSLHKIRIYLGNFKINPHDRTIETLVAHEFIHGLQCELELDWDHGEFFQTKAIRLEEYLKAAGYPIDKIYMKGTDE